MAQVKINWDNDGIKRMLSEASEKAVDEAMGAIERSIRAVRCSVHGESANVRKTGVPGGIRLQVEGCCEQLVADAEAVLARITAR